MSATRLPSDLSMRAYRLACRFICTCSPPRPVRIGAWEGFECRQCWHPIIAREHAIELVRQTLEHADDEP